MRIAWILAVTACGSSGGGKMPATTGELDVTITAPATPQVTVSGPNGFSMVLSATTALTGLEPGDYTATATPLEIAGPIVDTIQEAGAGSATVTAGDTSTIDITYAKRVGTGQLWYADASNSTLSSLDASVLATSGSPSAAVGLGLANMDPSSPAFDPAGNVWVGIGGTTPGSSALWRLPVSALAATGTPAPAATIALGFTFPDGLAFDPQGNLWVGGLTSPPSTVMFKASDLTGSGALSATPAVTITINVAGFFSGLAVDTSGTVWTAVRNNSSNTGVIHGYTTAQTGQSGSPTPAKMLTSPDMLQPVGMAFDTHGNLWVANWAAASNPDNVIRFDASLLAGSGSTTSSFTITSTAFDHPNGLAFDASGNLWVENASGSKLLRFPASELVGTGSTSLSPDVTLTTSAGGLGGIAFDPKPR